MCIIDLVREILQGLFYMEAEMIFMFLFGGIVFALNVAILIMYDEDQKEDEE